MHINIIYIYIYIYIERESERERVIYITHIFDDYIIHSYIIVVKDFMLTEKLQV